MPNIVAFLTLAALVCANSFPGDNNEVHRQEDNSKLQLVPYLRIAELHQIGKNIQRINQTAIHQKRHPCDSFYDYICGSDFRLFPVLGAHPYLKELGQIMNILSNDDEKFAAKQKLMDFRLSCHKVKSIDECYLETFRAFKPLFAYTVSKFMITLDDVNTVVDIMDTLIKTASKDGFLRDTQTIRNLKKLKAQLESYPKYFHVDIINEMYKNLSIYPLSYKHNVKNIAEFNELYKNDSPYESGYRNILDLILYVYQSRNKPRSYYYATLNVHIWMALYNDTAHANTYKHYQDAANCFKLPERLNLLSEARNMSVIYARAFSKSWKEYGEWINLKAYTYESDLNLQIHKEEEEILKPYHLKNGMLIFIYYAQNFCDFGKFVAENVFYHGLKNQPEFIEDFGCAINDNMNPKDKCSLLYEQ